MDHFLLFNPEWNYDRIICRFLLGDIDDKHHGVACYSYFVCEHSTCKITFISTKRCLLARQDPLRPLFFDFNVSFDTLSQGREPIL